MDATPTNNDTTTTTPRRKPVVISNKTITSRNHHHLNAPSDALGMFVDGDYGAEGSINDQFLSSTGGSINDQFLPSTGDSTCSSSSSISTTSSSITPDLNQTYTTEVYWQVHKVNHDHYLYNSLDTSLEDFGEEDDEEVDTSQEGSRYKDYANDVKVCNEAVGDKATLESDESGCETETTLKASGTDKEDTTSRDEEEEDDDDENKKKQSDKQRKGYRGDYYKETYNDSSGGLTAWRGVELFIREDDDDDNVPTWAKGTSVRSEDIVERTNQTEYVNNRLISNLANQTMRDENVEEGFREEKTCSITYIIHSECEETDLAETECDETDVAETECDETDVAEKECDETDIAELECNETDVAETECDETDVAETENDETDVPETEYDETDCDETDVPETDFDETDFPETDIGDTEYDETDLESTACDETDRGETEYSETDIEAEALKAKPGQEAPKVDEKARQDRKGNTTSRVSHGEVELERPLRETEKETEALEKSEKEQKYDREEIAKLSKDEKTEKHRTPGLRKGSTVSEISSTISVRRESSSSREMSVMRTRLVNLRKIIHEKNEEIRELKTRMKIEKSNAVANMKAVQKDKQNQSRQGLELVSSAELLHLRRELSVLRQEKDRLRAELATRAAGEREKALELRKLQQEHERHVKASKSQTKRNEVKEKKEVTVLEKTLIAKEKELKERQATIHKLECEKLYLGEEIFRITGVEEGFWSDQILTRPALSEKERCLVRRNSTLNTQLTRLQIHCKSLTSENDGLKTKMEVELERPLELREKARQRQKEVQLLKRKNTELTTITRKLEEKVKNLEKKTKESPATERRNIMLVRQREREAEYEKQLLERDREIQRLKIRMRDLVRKLTGKNGEITRAQSTLELEHIIRTVTKERLQLERHLAVANEGLSRGGSGGEADGARVAAAEERNAALRQQLDDLELLTRQHHTLQRHVQEKDLECVTLKEKLKLKNELCQDLECQLARVIEKNTELTIQNSDLQKQIQELQHVSEECKTLKHTLTQVETDWSSSKIQVGSLQGKVGNLESVLRQMKEAAEKRRDLERQHAEALAQLRERQALLTDVAHTSDKDRKASLELIEPLQSKIRELEKKAEVQNLRHEELVLEMQSLKKAQGSPKNSWSRSGSLSADLQSPDSGDVTPGLTSLNSLSSGVFTNTTSSSYTVTGPGGLISGNSPLPASTAVENASSEIDRIMAKIEQDDKILAELDKFRSTIGENLVNGNIPGLMLPPYETDNRVLDVLEIPGKGRCHVYIARYSYDPFHHSPNENPEAELAVNAGDYVLVWGAMDEDGFFDGELLDGRRGLVPSNFVEKLVGDDLIEFHQSVVMGLRDGDESVSTSVPQDLDFISQDESQLMIDLAVNQTRHNAYTSYIDLEDIIEEEDETMGEHVPPPVQLTLERQLNKSILIGWNPPPEGAPVTIESYHVYVDNLLKTTVRATERTRALVEGVDSAKLHRISVRSVTPNRRTSRDAACTMVIGKDAPLGPASVKATSITSTSAVISWVPSNSNFQHTVCVNNVEVRTVKPGVYRHTITGLSPNTTYRVTIRAKNLRAPQFDEKASKNQERLSTTIEFRTLPKDAAAYIDPKGLPDPPVDVQVEQGPQDGSLLVTWLPVTINSTGGTSNGAPVTGYAVYADGKKVTEVESPTGDHALIDLTKIPGFEPKQVTVRTKSRDAVSGDSVPSQIPNNFARGRGRGKDMHADGQKPGPHHGLPGPLHGPAGQHHGPQGPHHGPHGQHHGIFSGPGGLHDKLLGRRTASGPGVKTDHLGQTILEHEDNLSDKEIYPGHQQGQQGSHAPIPAIGKGVSRVRQITKDTTAEGHVPLEGFNEEDYELGPGGRGRFDPRGPHPRTHQERGRPPPPPHHNRPIPRDPREPVERRDPRDPHYREMRDPRDRRDPLLREAHAPRDPREPRDMRDRYDGEIRHRGGGDYGRDYPGGRGEGRGRGLGPGDQHTRIFVALFDYDPPTMSPNPDACDEELGFREGQLIKVYGDKDPDGFYWGEASGRKGFVPCNMVSEVQVDDERVAQEIMKESETGRRRRDGSVGRRGHQGDRWGDIYANMPVRKMIAMYDYDPQELSPNVDSEVELSFQTGDIIYVYGDMDDDGFYMGELRGQRGLVPSNFLQDAPQDYSDDHRSRRDTLDPRDRAPPPGQSGRGQGPGAHGPPPPPRPDQRDRRKDTRSVASKSVASAQDMRGPQGDLVDHHQDHVNSSVVERGGRSVSRERAIASAKMTTAASTMQSVTSTTTTASRSKLNGLDLLDEDVDNGPAISSADLDQLMADFDLNDPLLQEEETAKAAEATKAAEAAKAAETKEEKPGGLAGALPGGLGAGLSGLPNPMGDANIMGKLGDLATQNPVTDVMSKGKDFLFKKFGL